ncbi:MAG: T9SS C-terminal target domain-containing protein [Calditrichaeota bacterium]|nr:MAG: T9SS C-terminal target domain-containing protein [Calditrichota bacterium]
MWDVTSLITLGDSATLEYKPDLLFPYENACRPNNPNCIDGLTCDNCQYGVGGHYEPIYAIQGQLIHYELVTVVEVNEEVNFVKATEYELFENYPNPFNPETTIQFRIPKTEKVKLEIFNLIGQKIKILASGNEFVKGTHSLKWNGTDENGNQVSSGVYFYKLQTENFNQTNKMVLLK